MEGLTAGAAVVPGMAVTEGDDVSRLVQSTKGETTSRQRILGPEFLSVLASVLQSPEAEISAQAEEQSGAEIPVLPGEGETAITLWEDLREVADGTDAPDAETSPMPVLEPPSPRTIASVPESPLESPPEVSPEVSLTTPPIEQMPIPVDGGRPPAVFDFDEPSGAPLPLEVTVRNADAGLRGEGRLPLVGTAPNRPDRAPISQLRPAPGEMDLIGSEPEAATRVTIADTLRIEPDLSLLDPDLRVRLERVVERMRAEFGHNVKVVEAYRTPERQQALYAQGRTAPGPVVTWTQSSLHSEGLAVDVIVDASYAPHEGYRRLSLLAGEEGLNSLWPKDPGHLELGRAPIETQTRPLPTLEPPRHVAEVARPVAMEKPAVLAQLAAVEAPTTPAEFEVPATPAQVARPAEIAVPGSEPTPTEASRPELALAAASPAADRVAENDRSTERSRVGRLSALRGTGTGAEHAPSSSLAGPTTPAAETLAASVPARSPAPEAALPTVGSLLVGSPSSAAPESLHRISQIREIQELAYPRRLGQVTLRMMDGLGEEARMRVRLEGGGVSTAIGVRDLGQADLLRTRIGALEQSLKLQGIESTSVRIGALTNALEIVDTVKSASDSGRRSESDLLNNQQQRREDDREGREGRRFSGSRQDEAYQDKQEKHR